ncbi:4'-phosphopantetheinyl transferase family protein [Thermaerobacillus caldiproteolyticus]|uniref:4'-phosphopantetheinyl transferase n=1 Tax=Thermaerobacillus caldiproteolyticus TaxID=247480 RepID=A0A7V9Z8I5_9BACL|nr:4'-phosphopantetheinyl transferase superfamily protein [Anoxybacillus caldiproteolyticus]MBA2876032.1 4'-phosphopantetheinyl transferase [Anoxybacillus caldiproteolyticus]
MIEWQVVNSVPHISNDVCQVWMSKTTDIQSWHVRMLNDDERKRSQSFRKDEDRIRFIIGCTLSRLVLATQLNVAPHQVPIDRTCPVCHKPHGRPRLPYGLPQWSVSHSGDVILVAFTRDAPVGVDVEWINPDLDVIQMADGVLTEKEILHLLQMASNDRIRGFLTYWTRKEAVLKATGEGLKIPTLNVTVSGPQQTPRLLAFDGRSDLLDNAILRDLTVDLNYVAALSIFSKTPKKIEQYDASMLMQKGFGWQDYYSS